MQKEIELLRCPACDKTEDHTWHNVYFNSYSQLKEALSVRIAFCNKANKYVLTNMI